MKFQCYLCFDLEIEPFLFPFSDPDPVRILLLFPFLLLCSTACDYARSALLRWRARVGLQAQRFSDEFTANL